MEEILKAAWRKLSIFFNFSLILLFYFYFSSSFHLRVNTLHTNVGSRTCLRCSEYVQASQNTHAWGRKYISFWNIFKSNQMDILVLKIKFERSVPEFLFGRLWNILTGPVRAIQLGQNRMPLQHNSGRASIKYFRTFLRIMLLDCLMRDLYTTIGRHWGCLTQKGDIGVLPQQLRNKFFLFP